MSDLQTPPPQSAPPRPQPARDTPAGFAYALGAYVMWGFLPLYMKAMSHIPPLEIVAHRVIWSVPIAGLLVWAAGRMPALWAALGNRRSLAMAASTALLISLNWSLYVWAITSGHALEAALGYYINPLFSVFIGAVFLRERLSRGQMAAVALAALAVVVLTIEAGQIPWVALGLTVTWAAYALLKKELPLGPYEGFLAEVLVLSPFAIGLFAWFQLGGQGHFGADLTSTALLAGCGLVTAVPLITYANGAKRLRLSTIGILQYVSPTMIFLTAVFLFHEGFGMAQMLAFPLIWAALAVYTASIRRGA